MRKLIVAMFCVAGCAISLAQQVLNNDSVVKMVKAGLSDDVVVATINSSPGQYTTNPDGLIALKQAGVTDKVIAAMITKGSAGSTPSSPPTQPAVSNDPNDPRSPHEAGIWVNGRGKMVELEPSVYSSGKTGGMLATAMTYGIAKTKIKAVIRNAHSNTRVSDPGAAFYFYFEVTEAGLSNASTPFGGTTTPNEYVLIKFDVKNNSRETVTGKLNAYGASGGVDDKTAVDFTYEKLSPGVYKVTPKKALEKGEYGFMSPMGGAAVSPYGAAATSNKVFDFGVD